MRVLTVIAGFLLAVIIAAAAAGDDEEKKQYLYQWTDEKGMVHITDQLGNVPERHRSRALKIESAPPEDAGSAPAPSVPAYEPDMLPGGIPREEGLKAVWQSRMAEWNERLKVAEAKKQKLEEEKQELFRPWGLPLYAPAANRQRAEEIDRELEQVRKDIEEARTMIEETIPEEARKAGVPPGWLRQ